MLVVTIPLFGVLLAAPLFDAAADLRRAVRGAALGGLEGRHYVYKGRPIHVDQGEDCRRWIAAKDIEATTGIKVEAFSKARGPAAAPALRTIRGRVFVEADALHTWLAPCRSGEAGSFRLWVERTVAYPARRQREQQSPRSHR